MSDVGPDRTRALLAICCVFGLVLVAAFVPAVDQAEPDGDDRWSVPGEPDDAERAAAGGDGETSNVDDAADESDDGPTVAFDEEPVPGATANVSIEGAPLWDDEATVLLDGEAVATTHPRERVAVEIPYEEEVTLGVEGVDAPDRSYELPTELRIETDNAAVVGSEVGVRVTIADEPVADAPIRLDGEALATTDANGTATLSLPSEPGETTIAAERDAATGTESIELARIELDTRGWLLLPGGRATAEVTADGEPVRNATVAVSGGEERRTGADGTVAVSLPIADETVVEASRADSTAETTIDGLFRGLGIVLLAGSSLAIGMAASYRHLWKLRAARWEGPGDAPPPGITVADGLVGIANSVGRLLGSVPSPAAVASRLVGTFGRVGGAVLDGIRSGPLGSGSASGRSLPPLSMPSLSLPSPSLPSLSGLFSLRLLSSVGSDGGRSSGGSPSERRQRGIGTRKPEHDDGEAEPPDDRTRITLAWHALVDRLGVRRPETRTPGQLARRAVDEGFPRDAVVRLLSAFRDVEYGNREATAERVERAERAASELDPSSGGEEE